MATTRAEDYSKWYGEVIERAGMAEHSDVRGCMVIKPYGYAIWENIQKILDKKFKDTGHTNAYFPLFIPKSYLNKEAQHVEGFAKECAVVTHYRLKNNEGQLIVDPEAKLEEELIVRPTSETIIWNSYKNWVQSYRDLPILINQWANVVRWEMRTRLFLRTTEFLWQEGHTAHATRQEAIEEAERMLGVYTDFVQNYMAMPVVQGFKTANERFAGADETYCIEAMMQDGKALQAGTSHFLGQNFAKAFDVKFADKNGSLDYVWATSWGVSTRLIGGLIMTHSDDEGLVLPPAIAPIQVAIVPIYKSTEQLEEISTKVAVLKEALQSKGITVVYDDDDNRRPGWKFAEYEAKGVPVRVAIGPRDLENGQAEVARRDTKTKETVNWDGIENHIEQLLNDIQHSLFAKAKAYRDSHITEVNSYDEFKKVLEEKGGFISAHWDGTSETEVRVKEETKATIRCIPLDAKEEAGTCIFTGKPSSKRVLFAKAY
ncbi:MAG: proline--tRNA ligase [Brumimicrobium sp.]|nr:proline--tRNA ligase [Brumimicrobium sp.]MCO5268196.1 proline--tRNA ligase [Brumimicrobium sp.]